jgi:uncharacterized membrane protein
MSWILRMTGLIAVESGAPGTAFQRRAEPMRFRKEYLIATEEVVVVKRENDRAVNSRQAVNLTTAGAAGGALWSALFVLARRQRYCRVSPKPRSGRCPGTRRPDA